MIQGIDSTSLSLIEKLNEFQHLAWQTEELCKNIFTYKNVKLGQFGELCKSLEQLQIKLPVIRMQAQTLCAAYASQYSELFAVREHLLEKIKNGRSMGNQMNLLPSQYDEENLINEIITVDRDDHTSKFRIADTRIDPIIDPASYSNEALVKRFEMEDTVIGALGDYSSDLFKILENDANASIQDIIDTLAYCESPEINTLFDMSEFDDAADYSIAVNQKIPIRRIANSVSGAADAVSKAFNVLQEMIHNYEIYQTAVKSYTATALESVLGPKFEYKLN